MVVKILSHSKLRNVEENLLSGHHLKRNTIFYGINGSGKSTICSLLASLQTPELQCTKEPDTELAVFAFNKEWRESTVGPFLQGESVQGVTTVQMSPNFAETHRKIKQLKKKLEGIDKKISEKKALQEAAGRRIDSTIEKVSTGDRTAIARQCNELGTRRFTRSSIRSLLEKDEGLEVLSPEKLEENIDLATSTAGQLSPMIHIPRIWTLPEEIWQELATPAVLEQKHTVEITQWIREGLQDHKSGDHCAFCAGILTPERVNELENAIKELDSQVSDTCTIAREEAQSAASEFKNFYDRLENFTTSDVQYRDRLENLRLELRDIVASILEYCITIANILKSRIEDPSWVFKEDQPTFDKQVFEAKVAQLVELHAEIHRQISRYSKRRGQAIDNLKLHCCAKDGSDWKAANEALGESISALNEAEQEKNDNEYELERLMGSVSSTNEIAEFIDKNLCLILGDRRLRVEHDPKTHGYRILRQSRRASDLSEGEQKLISLLYFCAQFKEDPPKTPIENSIILFDDLGSELDEARLYAVDRFITETFKDKLNPKVICYFTHSFAHFRILQGRLANKAVSEGGTAPKASFYEIYKKFEDAPESEHTTQVRVWEDAALKLDSDYTLSFYLLIEAYQSILEDSPVPFSTANDCRKVLEVFTEFKEPAGESFGRRMDKLSSARDSPVKYAVTTALSQLVNYGSHSELGRKGALWSRGLLERCVVDTIRYMKALDEEHFFKMLKKTHKDNSILRRRITEEIKPFNEDEILEED